MFLAHDTSEYVTNAEVGSRPFAAEAVVQSQRTDGRTHTDADARTHLWLEAGVLGKVVNCAVATTPGVASIHEDHAHQVLRQRCAILHAQQRYILAPETVFGIAAQAFRPTQEELLEEGQLPERFTCVQPHREHVSLVGKCAPAPCGEK